jgi:cytochrome c553
MKKIALSLILACGVAMAAEANATEANATAPAAEANKTVAEANATASAATAAGDVAAGKAAFAKCVSCHGANADKKALGKSDVIAGWDAAKVETALKEYKAGTRKGHGMEGVMKGQVAALSDADIANIAAFVASLKK